MQQFIEDDSQGKDVGFDGVVALDERLYGHVEGSSYVDVVDEGPGSDREPEI